ncbi:ABC transporter ATP-binding protein [Streptomyces griseomycini]|uniref:Multiple sugar transport system ATP-binding protein n=1 Tax=Streptomyces griseomycini TaxID=66895 RepID=A0A7W7PYG6_9ACTN|nr:ABC transporter ATP-binding protein [Streptomyces griseomycini]MBB4903624.1 multiple sugar transport system ATP-binding protein [Streptomyces griseomycini]GGR58627.1 sugar ABC transporter ATP-binding protein [Streptomyces griseomycini]
MGSTITLHNVAKTYPGGQPALRHISLSVAASEFLVLLGPSGCGKSTLLRMIAGLETITEGELHLDGTLANDLDPSERDTAMIFQNFALYPNMTAAQNIGFPLAVHKQDPADASRHVEAAAHALGISHLLDRLPGRLSGGERQRVAMGRATVRQPSVFLLDEPLSSLDARLRTRLRLEILSTTRKTGATTIYVTHDQAEAMALGDRVAVLRDGILQQVDTPRSLYTLPANAFVASFVGIPRISLIHGTVYAPIDGALSLSLGAQQLFLPVPLSRDHQMLRVMQGSPLLIGLRPEAVRIAEPTQATPVERALTAIIEHVEFQGHETLLHLSLGGRPADVPPQPLHDTPKPTRSITSSLVHRLLHHTSLPSKQRITADSPVTLPHAEPPSTRTGELVIRAGSGTNHRRGQHLPLLVDVRNLLVFNHQGERVSPDPTHIPDL